VRSFASTFFLGLLAFLLARWSGGGSRQEESAAGAKTPSISASAAPIAATDLRPIAKDQELAPAETARKSGRIGKQEIVMTFRGADPFGSATRALALVDALTAEDFQKMAAKRELPEPSTYGMDREFSTAFLESYIERWFAVEPAGALPAIQRLAAEMSKAHLAGARELISTLARLRPELLLSSHFSQGTPIERGTMGEAFTALAARDLPAARALLAKVVDPDFLKSAEIAIAQGIAKADPLSGVALARELNNAQVFASALKEAEWIGPGVLRQVLLANAGKFPIGFGLTELILRHPNEDWTGLFEEDTTEQKGVPIGAFAEAGRLTPADRQRLIDRLETLPASARESVAGALMRNWTKDDPRAAIDWALARAKPADANAPETTRVNWGYLSWIRANEAEARAWWAKLPPSAMRNELGNLSADLAARNGDVAQALSTFRPQAGLVTQNAMIAIAKAESEPARAAQWLTSLPAEIDTRKPVQTLIEKWSAADPAAAAAWVESLAPGTRRDAALSAYARATAQRDAAAAGEWAGTIADPTTRAIAAEFVYTAMHEQNPPAARAWLRQFPGIDETVRDRWMRLR
jgi:hypothetical protein